MGPGKKPLNWVGTALKDLRTMPLGVRKDVGVALHIAQLGGRSAFASPLVGFGGAGVLEIWSDHDGDAFRAVYTVRFSTAIFVLHVFQKKSKRGAQVPKPDMDLIRRRLAEAGRMHRKLH